jgi:hypothetical protein
MPRSIMSYTSSPPWCLHGVQENFYVKWVYYMTSKPNKSSSKKRQNAGKLPEKPV